jgi:hypothetical protein
MAMWRNARHLSGGRTPRAARRERQLLWPGCSCRLPRNRAFATGAVVLGDNMIIRTRER